ncbi:MAG TPA: PKD domain-containing protein [Chitinophagales bacterium]|nr:PKD domain-containing protein [Chitinophagales bacterium]
MKKSLCIQRSFPVSLSFNTGRSVVGLLLFLFISNFLFAQNPLVKQWDYRFGGTDEDYLSCFQQTSDGGFILGGYSLSDSSGDKTQTSWGGYDYWIVKIDSLGVKQWDKRFGGIAWDYLYSLEQTTDGGYILGGTSYSGIGGDKTEPSWGGKDYWIVKIDSVGVKQWDKRFGGTAKDEFYSLEQTIDGGYILGGNSESGISGDKTQPSWGGSDYWIVKTDSLGVKQWDNRFGGTETDVLTSLQQTTDGGYILQGHSYSGISGDKTQGSWGGADYWIVKTDSLGVKQWDKRFGGVGADGDGFYTVQQTTDGGYILGGLSLSGIGGDKTEPSWGEHDYWTVKTDSLGVKQWDKRFGGTDNEYEFGNITQTSDDGYLIAGASNSYISGDKTENNLALYQTWVVKTDSLGNKLWDKTLLIDGKINGGYAIQTKDGCYAMADANNGSIAGDKTQSMWGGGDDFWIIKFCDTTTIIQQPPQSAFTSNANSGCANSCFEFTSTSVNATAYQWFFVGGNPAISTQQNPNNICYNTSGSYDVTLITSNAYGSDTLTLANYITVYAAPAPPIITQSNDTLTSSAAYSYQWFMNGSVIPAATNQLLIITQSGDYSVTITDSLGCSASDTIAAVWLYPQSAFNSNTISGCPGSCFDFTNASLNATSYQWFFTGGNPASSLQQNPPSICYANPGVYDVMLIASSNFASDTLVQAAYITIFTPLVVSISQNGNFLTCNPAAASYQWSLNGNQIPGATSQTLFINQTGIFTIEVIDMNGCNAFDTLVVNNIPSPNFSTPDTTLCEKFCTGFFDQSTNNPTAWQWIFPGGDPASSTSQNPVNICYDSPGTYDVTLITTNANGNDTLTLQNYITVYPTPPFPTITQVDYTLTSSPASYYQWQFNSADIPGATNQSYTILQTGYYTVVVSDLNGCINSFTVYVLISGINDLLNDGNISVYPNPSSGDFIVEWLNGLMTNEVSIDVVNTLGQIIFSSAESRSIGSSHLSEGVSQGVLTDHTDKKEIDLNDAARGVYFIVIKTGNEFVRKKILIAY